MNEENQCICCSLCSLDSQRGDGFPLASMLAAVSMETKDLGPVLAAHVYTVCPTAIPTLPHIAEDVSEDELMTKLGMQRGKDGSFETFERFMARTEVRNKKKCRPCPMFQGFLTLCVVVVRA